MEFSKRMELFGVSIFAQMAEKRKQLEERGVETIDLGTGAPNIPPAQHIMDALAAAVQDKSNYVYAIKDTPELQQAVADWYKRRYGVMLDPATQVSSLLGSQEGLAHIALSIVDEGDIVMVPDPCYPIFGDGARLAGATLHYMPQRKENGYVIDLDEIPEDVAKKAKLMVVSYPNNPTTVMAPDCFYEKLVAFAKKYDIIVLHDNAYSELVFDGADCGSFLRFPGAMEVGIEFNSLSKTYGMAGARCGFCVGNAAVVGNLVRLKSNLDFGMFLPLQKAAVAAITGPQDCVAETAKAYKERRDALVDGLNAIGWQVDKPVSTMFVWARLPEGYTDSRAFAFALADKTGIIATPGAAFGPSGEGHIRFALIQNVDKMLEVVDRIQKCGMLKK